MIKSKRIKESGNEKIEQMRQDEQPIYTINKDSNQLNPEPYSSKWKKYW